MTLSVYQATEYSELVYPGSSNRLPFWLPTLSGSCPNCVYTWSISKMTDTYVPVTLDSGDIYESYGRPALQHRFTEPGTYKIYLRTENAASCPYTGTDRPYLWASVLHYVTSSAPATTIPVVSVTPTDMITVVPMTTTRAAAGMTPAPVVTTQNPIATAQVTPFVTAGATRQPTAAPQGTAPLRAQPTITATRSGTETGTGGQAAGATPGATTAGPAGVGNADNSSITTTTLLLGVIAVLALIICAGVLYLVFKKK